MSHISEGNPWNLTPRQEQVLQRLAGTDGRLKSIAREIGIDVRTAETHLSRARARIGVKSTIAAAIAYDRWARAKQ